ncbi:hypothetical protein OPU71_18020 [Niveibacterium sp. 24ML]|uniref:hypothetical protein n=1 Tax=Niveibacterium sp. 24ML TaxID=2985512 RepID=UPI00226F0A58|nr:hypothetical protein [Niveibacterium sp. 24ML]MCX9158025.1 hypothetical protein [Niveibacterium sp. 24ML]
MQSGLDQQDPLDPCPATAAQATLKCYRPSGRVSPIRLLRALALAVPLLCLISWGYALVMLMNPPWWFAPLAFLIFAAFASGTIASGVRRGHSRSPGVNTAVAVALSALAIWIRWLVTFRGLSLEHGLAFAHAGPLEALGMLWQLAHDPVEPSAEALPSVWRVVCWMLESGLLLVLAAAVSRAEARKPYSESAKRWATQEEGGELYWLGGRSSDLEAHLAAHGPRALCEMLNASTLHTATLSAEWWTIHVKGWKVEEDAAARWLGIEIVAHRRGDDGKIKSLRRDLIAAWETAPEDYAAVLARFAITATPDESSVDARRQDDATAPELRAAVAALEAENHATAIALARAQTQHPDPAVRADAYRICALAYSGQSDWGAAFEQFHELFAIEPSAHNALQLATTSVMGGELTRGQAWFDKALEINAVSGDTPPPRLRTAYMSALEQAGELQALIPHLEWLAAAYRGSGTTDSHLLWTRGLPFLSVFLDKSLPILRANLAHAQIEAWYASLAAALDDDGKAAIRAHLARLESI